MYKKNKYFFENVLPNTKNAKSTKVIFSDSNDIINEARNQKIMVNAKKKKLFFPKYKILRFSKIFTKNLIRI